MNKFKMPIIFVGHGSPMSALPDNIYSEAWRNLGLKLAKPKAILLISAHWVTNETAVSNVLKPKQIYDFYGFPDELYEIRYSVVGSPELAKKIQELLVPIEKIEFDNSWGIDHGAWVPLARLFPKADIPVVQLSINGSKAPEYHYQIGRALRNLREDGYLIVCSGNIVHNLGLIDFDESAVPFTWASKFDEYVSQLINSHDYQKLIDFEELGPEAKLSIPTPEHYLPLLYFLGLQFDNEEIKSFGEGISNKSISMRSLITK